MFPKGICRALWHCYLLRRACFPGNLVILLGMASCERFAIKHVKYAGNEGWKHKRSITLLFRNLSEPVSRGHPVVLSGHQ